VYVQYVAGTAFLARTIGEENGVMTAGGVYGVGYSANWHIPVGGRICTLVSVDDGNLVMVYQAEPTTYWANIAYWGQYTDVETSSNGSVRYLGRTLIKQYDYDLVVDACMHWQK
jgi:hypothetical protein